MVSQNPVQRDDDAELRGDAGGLVSPLDALLGYRLRRASMAMMSDLLVVLRPIGLSAGEASLLFVVGANPGCTQSDASRTLDIKRANMVPLVARMKARGLIDDVPIDGRSRGMSLTAQGIALRDKALRRVTASDARFRDRLETEATSLIAALRRIGG